MLELLRLGRNWSAVGTQLVGALVASERPGSRPGSRFAGIPAFFSLPVPGPVPGKLSPKTGTRTPGKMYLFLIDFAAAACWFPKHVLPFFSQVPKVVV